MNVVIGQRSLNFIALLSARFLVREAFGVMTQLDPQQNGILVPFPPPEARPVRAPPGSGVANILLFTGIRYERQVIDTRDPADEPKQKKARSRLRPNPR